jgi:hypothetical protein
MTVNQRFIGRTLPPATVAARDYAFLRMLSYDDGSIARCGKRPSSSVWIFALASKVQSEPDHNKDTRQAWSIEH